jgi:hypothetical protein
MYDDTLVCFFLIFVISVLRWVDMCLYCLTGGRENACVHLFLYLYYSIYIVYLYIYLYNLYINNIYIYIYIYKMHTYLDIASMHLF